MNVLVTGATGFIGQHLVKLLRARGDSVTALVRPSSRRASLERMGVHFAFGDLLTGEGLAQAVRGVDRVFHLAGLTKAREPSLYFMANRHGTARLMEATARRTTPPRVVYCSSLSAAGPALGGNPRVEEDPAAPVSLYGRSKLAGEDAVREWASQVSSVIVRPPVVYGPGDQEFLPSILPMIRLGLVLKNGLGPKHYSIVHVEDLCRGLLAAAEQGASVEGLPSSQGVYFVSDVRTYRWEEICQTLASAVGRRRVRILALPDAVNWAAGVGSEWRARLSGTVPILSRDKARELSCAAWTCSIAKAQRELGFTPAISLAEGFASTLRWVAERAAEA